MIKKRALISLRLLKLQQCFVFFINYVYLSLKQKQTKTLNQPWRLLCKQNKQNKTVWQQLQITATELRKDFFKVYHYYYHFFCYFILISTKIHCLFFWSSTTIDGKSYRVSIKTFFGVHLNLTKKSYRISLLSNRTPSKKTFFVPPLHKHTTLAPGRPLTVRCSLSQRKSGALLYLNIFLVRFLPT